MFKQCASYCFAASLLILSGAVAVPCSAVRAQFGSGATSQRQAKQQTKKKKSKLDLRTDDEIREALSRVCSDVEFSEATLEDVSDYLADKIGVPVLFDRRTLEEEGIGIDEPIVTINVDRVTWHDVLGLILEEHDLTYMIKHRVLMITTIDVAEQTENLLVNNYDTSAIFAPASVLAERLRNVVRPDKWDYAEGNAILSPLGENTLMFAGDETLRRRLERCLEDLTGKRIVGAARDDTNGCQGECGCGLRSGGAGAGASGIGGCGGAPGGSGN